MKYVLADKIGPELVKTMDLISDPVPYGILEYFGKRTHTIEHFNEENMTHIVSAASFYWEMVCIDAIANFRSDLDLVAKTSAPYDILEAEIGELACDLLTQIATERLECFEERVIVRYVLNTDVEIINPS
jgi:hypothetical protein